MDGLLNISYEEYSSVELMMPSIPEQHALADYFRKLDNLVTLHQWQLVDIANDIFSRKNEKPTIRYSEIGGFGARN